MHQTAMNKGCYLKVENFLCLTNVECELKGVNIFIGPQAEGKSLIAKLLYFFQKFLFHTIKEGLQQEKTIEEIAHHGVSDFETFFPGKTWSRQEFKIYYKQGDFSLSLAHNNERILVIGESLTEYITSIKSRFEEDKVRFLEYIEEGQGVADKYLEQIKETFPKDLDRKITFVPAQRSFYSILYDKIFTAIRDNVYIDPFLVEYGSDFELFNMILSYMESIGTEHPLLAAINKDIGPIIKGAYGVENKKRTIITKHGTVELRHASSGQQEVVPLAPLVYQPMDSVFIEEPEAHLYPSSQKEVVEFLAGKYNSADCSLVITTHSPYVLTTINNLIAAHNASLVGEKQRNRVAKVVSESFWIPFEDVTAWYVSGGSAESMLSIENKLIDATAIDEISDKLAREFDQLLDIQFDGDVK